MDPMKRTRDQFPILTSKELIIAARKTPHQTPKLISGIPIKVIMRTRRSSFLYFTDQWIDFMMNNFSGISSGESNNSRG